MAPIVIESDTSVTVCPGVQEVHILSSSSTKVLNIIGYIQKKVECESRGPPGKRFGPGKPRLKPLAGSSVVLN